MGWGWGCRTRQEFTDGVKEGQHRNKMKDGHHSFTGVKDRQYENKVRTVTPKFAEADDGQHGNKKNSRG